MDKIIQEGENIILENNKPDYDIMAKVYKELTNKTPPKSKKELLQLFPIKFYLDTPKDTAIEYADKIYKSSGSKYVRVGTNLSKDRTYFIDTEFVRVAEFVYIPKEYNIFDPNYSVAISFLELAKPLGDPEYWENKIAFIKKNKLKLKKSGANNGGNIKKLVSKYLSAGLILGGEAGLDAINGKDKYTVGDKLIFYTDKLSSIASKGKKFEAIPNLLPPRIEINESGIKIVIFENDDCFSYLDKDNHKIASPYLIFYYYIIADMIDFDHPSVYTYNDFAKFDFTFLTKECIGILSEVLKKNLEKKNDKNYYINYYPGK
jgi:hypothetical protein